MRQAFVLIGFTVPSSIFIAVVCLQLRHELRMDSPKYGYFILRGLKKFAATSVLDFG